MTKPMPADTLTTIAPPDDMASLFESAGLVVTLTVSRADGAPLTEADHEVLPVLVDGYALGREVNPTNEQLAEGAARIAREREALTRTGTGGE